MMNDKEKWMDAVMYSMRHSERAEPNAELYEKIEAQLYGTSTKVIPLYQWKSYVAAVVILLLNISAVLYYNTQGADEQYQDMAGVDIYEQSFVTSYQIYK